MTSAVSDTPAARPPAQGALRMLPTAVTMTSLLSASTALVLLVMAPASLWRDVFVAACLGYSMMADGIDGPLARRLNATTSLGAHLDSLCDLTAFGLVPPLWLIARNGLSMGAVVVIAGVCWIAAAAFRLARFAEDGVAPKDGSGKLFFRGVPTPVAAAALVTVVMASTLLSMPALEVGILVVGATLMPSTLPYPKAGVGRWPWVAAVPVSVVVLGWWASTHSG